MTQDRNRRATIWIVAVSAVTVMLLIAFLLIPFDSSRWDGMKSRVEKLKEEARSRNVSRPVLRGEAIPGNAWDEYRIALRLALAFKEDGQTGNLARFNTRDTGADRAMVERLIAAHPGVIDHLRRGAQRSNGQYPYQWERGSEGELPSLLAARRTTQLAIAQARILEENGRPQDAADLLLDTSQFGSDLATNGVLLTSLSGLSMYQLTLDGLRDLILSRKLSPQQLAAVARQLEIADRNFPTLGPGFTNEAALTGFDMQYAPSSVEDWWRMARQGSLRYGLSPQNMTLDAFEQRDSFAQRIQKIDKLPFDAATKAAQAIEAEAKASKNPLVQMSGWSVPKILGIHREVHARLRLLRAATIYLSTGDMPELADPFGNNLSYAQEAGKLKIWSNGTIVLEISGPKLQDLRLDQ